MVENVLLTKSYYKKFIDHNDDRHPVRVLSEAYFREQQHEAELSEIRFSQGEVYYDNKDYEVAIYKWKKVSGHLEPWAKKNIADAYYQLGHYSKAEEIYITIKSTNVTLTTEVSLQLFSVYKQQEKLNQAAKVIRQAVATNPDYPNVTALARSFFEEYRDWSSAIELAVNEAIRTKSTEWYDRLKGYVEKGLTIAIAPDYFSEALLTLANLDQERFEQIVSAFWNSYKNEEYYLSWLSEFNHLFLNLKDARAESSRQLSILYQESYFDLISGRYFTDELADVVPNLLTNWLSITDAPLLPSAAVLAWNETFSMQVSPVVVDEAKAYIEAGNGDSDTLVYNFGLFESIMQWVQEHEIELDDQLTSLSDEIIATGGDDHFISPGTKAEKSEQILSFIRQLIAHLVEQPVEIENSLVEMVNYNQELVTKLNGATNQVIDIEKEQIKVIKTSFQNGKDETQAELKVAIPALLRECTDLIKEDSDFRTIHAELNKQMNEKIQRYTEEKLAPTFNKAMQDWLEVAETAFKHSQSALEDVAGGINAYYGDEEIKLVCDFKILEDWRRDTDRLINRLEIEEINIVNGFKPAQLLLRSSGKLLGALPTNKAMLQKAYKKFIENEEYEYVIAEVIQQFNAQAQFIEKGLEQDITMFFKQPLEVLGKAKGQANEAIHENEEKINALKTNPEEYMDPLKLFEVRLRQSEWMSSEKRPSFNNSAE
ncbi:tetratricopeptide repeat protein [Desertibacillus haloalkaliphilus]|uniref:tetratricopeptide repeat protein n=1 Tax=Desertibacillus haloalkaliphilus TaxID=1328930 RepID=UPI001C268BEE|nr:hypothetical protein [Desertibacillus haloalkaliphilus]MBU8905338.1 hypothetical protein [Desertibacillus haloalkaliphilus]